MNDSNNPRIFWEDVEDLVKRHALVIDRPKGSHHPRYPEMIYPLDYGYLEGTTSMDQGGIDVWVGGTGADSLEAAPKVISGLILTVDMFKNDAEIKIALNCREEDIQIILAFHNSNTMGAIVIPKPKFD